MTSLRDSLVQYAFAIFAALPVPFFGIPYNGTRLLIFSEAGGREILQLALRASAEKSPSDR
jgi:hypothetical protein